MWVLKTEGPAGSLSAQYVLYAGKHEIGRSGPKPDNTGCDGWISFPGVDKSISRNHASITVKPLVDPHVIDQRQPISIRDKSKFGVSIDDVHESYREKSVQTSQASQKSVHQIQKDTEVPLSQGCSITVGVNNSRLRLEWEELIACHSLLSKAQIAALNDDCSRLGIHVSRSWSERVRLLVMHQMQMTPKLLLALIDQKDIVTPDYMIALRSRADLKDPIPDPMAHGALWEEIRDEAQNRIKHWRHKISGQIQDHEPPAEEMSERYLFRPDFVPGFSDVFKPFFTPTERSKGPGSKSHARASLFVNRVLVFVHGDSGTNVRQYKQVCERVKAKVEVWDAAHVIAQWPTYQAKLPSSDKKCIWHVLLSEHEEVKGVVEEVILRLRAAGVIYSNLDSVWNAIVKADLSSISRDEFEAGWTQSLDSSAQPDALSLSLPCSSFQHTARSQAGREERPETSNKKRQRDAEGAEPVKASPHAVKSANGRQADNAAKRGDVIQIEEADSPEKPKSPAASRAAKRTRGGGASAPAPAPAVLPAASPATGARAHGSEAADTRDRAGIAGPSKSPHTASPATTRRQRDAEKLNDKAGKEGKESAEGKQGKEASIPSSRSAPATRAPAGSPAKPAGDRQVPETRVRKILNAEPAGQAGAHAKSSEASEEGDARGSSAARARPACRRFQMQDEADPEGWVTIVSDGPAPRLSMPAAAAAQMRAGGAASAGAGAVVNFKRFFKKSNGAAGIRSKPGARPVIAFDVWPKRAAASAASAGAAGGAGQGAGGGRAGGGARRRAAGGGKASASRRSWGSDESADE